MAGKHLHPRSHSLTFSSSATSVALVFIPLSLLAFILLYTFSSSHVPPQNPSLLSSPNPKPDFSFVSSLEKFLLVSRSATEQTLPDPIDGHEAAAKDLDSRIWWREVELLYEKPYDPTVLRIYVYDMPKKFTYDLLWLFRNTYRETTNLTSNGSPVHRLIEQHAVDYWLWADLIAPESERLLKNVVRVQRQEDANLFYIPFFTTISFFLMEKQQCKALYRVRL